MIDALGSPLASIHLSKCSRTENTNHDVYHSQIDSQGLLTFELKNAEQLEQSGFRSDFTTRGEWAEADKSECSEPRVVLEETSDICLL